MKKSACFLLLSIAFSSSVTFAQHNFNLQEMVNLTSKNAPDFETKMLENDYSLQSKMSDEISKVFTSDKAGESGKKYKMVRRQVTNSKIVGLTFSTTDKKYYLSLKADLAKNGYKFVREENQTIEKVPATWYHYKNGPMNVSICSYTTDITWFTVQAHL